MPGFLLLCLPYCVLIILGSYLVHSKGKWYFCVVSTLSLATPRETVTLGAVCMEMSRSSCGRKFCCFYFIAALER